MATDVERSLSIIQEKVELLTGERAKGEKRAVRISEIEGYIKTLNEKAIALSEAIVKNKTAITEEYLASIKEEHDKISAEIDASVSESVVLLNKDIAEARAIINDVRRSSQAARLEAHTVFQDAQTSITKLRQESNDAFAELAEIAETILDLRSDVDGNAAAITQEAGARATADTALSGQITTITANVASNAAAITSEAVARASADSALSSRIDNIVAASGGSTAQIDAEITARIAGDNALAAQITTVSAQSTAQRVFNQSSEPSGTGRIVGDLWYDSSNGLKPYYWNGTGWADNSDNRFSTIAASVTAETTARTNADSALSAQISTLTSTVNGNTSAINNEAATRASADSALSASLTSLTSTVNTNKATLDQEAVTRANADSALSGQITSLTSTVNTNKASLDTEIATRASADSAIASSVTTLSSSVNSKLNAKRTWRQPNEPAFADMFPPGVNSFAEANLDKTNYFSPGSGVVFGGTYGSLTYGAGRDISPDWTLSGGHTLFANLNGTMPNKATSYADLAIYGVVSNDIVPGQIYELSFYVGAHRCQAHIRIDYYSASNVYLSSYYSDPIDNNEFLGGKNLSGYKRLSVVGAAPASAAFAYFVIIGTNQGVNTQPTDPYLYVTRPYFGVLPEGQKATPIANSTLTEWQPFEAPVWYDTDDNNKLYIWRGWAGVRFEASDDARIASNAAAITQEAVTRANADGSLASQITGLTTIVGNNTASISTLQGSYDGLAVKYGVTGTINGQTGGFVLTGVGKNDGSAAYNLEITSNVTINGNLLVNGTVKNQGLEDYAVSSSGQATGIKSSGDLSVRVRKNARVACIASYSSHENDMANGVVLKVSANGNLIGSTPALYPGFDFIYPTTLQCVYPGNLGTRIQGSGQASASAEYSYTESYVAYYVWAGYPAPVYATRTVSFPAAYAFDDSQSSLWLAAKSGSPWLRYVFTQGVQVGAYKIMGYSSLASGSTQGRAPKAWSLQGSNNGTSWTTLDTRSNQINWGNQEDRQFEITGTNGVYNSYTQYRLVVTESVDAGETLVGVVQLSFFLPGDVADVQNVVFRAYLDTTATINGTVSLYVVELSK